MSSVLIGVDDSSRSLDAVTFARVLAGRSRSRVIVACAFPYDDESGRAASLPYREALEHEAQQTAQCMSDGLEGIPRERIRIAAVADLSPARALRRLAEDEHASIVVIGSSAGTPLGGVVSGAIAERLLHGSPCPVAIVPDGYRDATRPAIRRIGVAYHGSREGTLAIGAAIAAAKAFEAELEVIDVAERGEDAELEQVLASMPAGVNAEAVRLTGDAVEQIVARTSGLDLLIVGSRGFGPLHSALAAGVSGRVAREARCPVIAIPGAAEAPLEGLFDSPGGGTAPLPPLTRERPRGPSPILAAYDPFLEDRAPVELAVAVHELTGAPVLAGSVFPAVPVAEMIPGTLADPGLLETRDCALGRLRTELGVRSIAVSGLSVPRELSEIARREHPGLIVVGSTRRAGIGRVLPGSTAGRLLHAAPCPVALAPNGYRRAPFNTIAVGFIDTPEGHAALAAAQRLAERAGARVRAITALHPSNELDAKLAEGTPLPRGILLEGHHRAEALDALERAIAALPTGVDVNPEIQVDDPARALLWVSAHVDLIVCGSRGHGPLRSVLLGGVSRRLLEGSRCAVLVLPRGVERPLDFLLDGRAQTAAR